MEEDRYIAVAAVHIMYLVPVMLVSLSPVRNGGGYT